MQENLDVLISFVVIIIGLSVLVQIVVEVVKNFLKLRWAVYEQFLKDTYRRYFCDDVTIKEKDYPDKDKSESSFLMVIKKYRQRARIGSIRDRFKTFHAKVISFLEQVDKLRDNLLKIKQGLENGMDQKDMASLLTLVHQLDLDNLQCKWKKFDDLFEVFLKNYNVEWMANGGKLNSVITEVEKLITEVGNGRIERHITKTIDNILKDVNDIEKFIGEFNTKISDNMNSWLQDLENRYSRNIATWIFFIGILVVFALNGDAILIYRTLKNDPAVRESIMNQSRELTESLKVSSRSEKINDLTNSAKKIREDMKDHGRLDETDYNLFLEEYKSVAKAISDDTQSFNRTQTTLSDSGRYTITLPFNLTNEKNEALRSLKEDNRKIQKNEKLTKVEISKIEDSLDSALIRITKNYAAFQIGLINSQKEMLYSSDLPLGWNAQRLRALDDSIMNVIEKGIGLFVTTVLISFGAPFWNDVLKSLFGVRSFLRKSEAVDKRQ